MTLKALSSVSGKNMFCPTGIKLYVSHVLESYGGVELHLDHAPRSGPKL